MTITIMIIMVMLIMTMMITRQLQFIIVGRVGASGVDG